MFLARTMYGQAEHEQLMPLIDPGSSASLLAGAALLWGTTTNHSGLIRGTGALTNFVGVLKTTTTTSEFGTVAAGTLPRRHVTIDNGCVWLAEWDQTSGAAVTSSTSTVVTVASMTDDFDGGYLYVYSGTGSGQLRYIGAADTTTYTVGTSMSFTTTPDGTSNVVCILSAGKQLVDVITNATKLKAANATYTGRLCIIKNLIKHDAAGGYVEMVPGTHGTLDGLSNPSFFAEVVAVDSWWNRIA